MSVAELRWIEVEGHGLAYRELGEGSPVLLLHGWPASSYLWRNLNATDRPRPNRVVAVARPGFGASDKPLDVDYGFDFHAGILDTALRDLGIDEVALAMPTGGGHGAARLRALPPGEEPAELGELLAEFSPRQLPPDPEHRPSEGGIGPGAGRGRLSSTLNPGRAECVFHRSTFAGR
jgi:pimeloyl-ACP methyl ester carboxylesterase